MPILSQIDIPSATVLAAIVGGLSAALVNFVTGCISRHYETKRQWRELAIKAGIENCRHLNELKIEMVKAAMKGHYVIETPDACIIHMLFLMEVAANPKLSAKQVSDEVKRRCTEPIVDTYSGKSSA